MAYETTEPGRVDRSGSDLERERRLRDRPMGVGESLAAVGVGCAALGLVAASVGLFGGIVYRVFVWASGGF